MYRVSSNTQSTSAQDEAIPRYKIQYVVAFACASVAIAHRCLAPHHAVAVILREIQLTLLSVSIVTGGAPVLT